MHYKKTIAACLTGLFLGYNKPSAQVLMPSKAVQQNTISLNGSWKFKHLSSQTTGADSLFYTPDFNVSNWASIKTPGNWELQGFGQPVYARGLKEESGLYRTSFQVPGAWAGNPIYLCFDGVCYGYSIWVNGQYAGQYASSFNRHIFDVSAFAKPGSQNTLAVKVITHPKGWEFDTNDDWTLSGIVRDVTLFSLPPVHLQDMRVQTTVNGTDATLSVQAVMEKNGGTFPTGLSVEGQLSDATGKSVKTFSLAPTPGQLVAATTSFSQQVSLLKPALWTAETPNLYTLQLTVKAGGKEIQQYSEKIGIRQISWTDGVLKLNGSPIKLRGATHHDLSPVNGRSITEPEMIQDLKLMQAANINFIRTSHYPPNPRLLELCDSMGIYMMDEVPYGFGDDHLNDTSYLPILLQRAQATVSRDKNRPSVIIWSVGNENPVTDIGLKTGLYVKSMDRTRPYCFPQTPGEFEKMLKSIPDSVELLDDHYARADDLRRYLPLLNRRPMLLSEYAHALGLDFNDMDSIYEALYTHPQFAGGAVWEFIDQGILRKAKKPIVIGEPTLFAWASADTLYDTGDNQGTDGVLYANRVPQVDYWQVRKVYSPVKAANDTFRYRPGSQTFNIRLQNRFDFTNLSAITCRWELMADATVLSSGTLPLNVKPHDSVTIPLNVVMPAQPTANFYYLKLTFTDKKKYSFYEKTYLVQQPGRDGLLNRMVGGTAKLVKTNNIITTPAYRFELKDSGILLKNYTGETLISRGFFARVGRKPTMAQDATTTSRRSKARHTLWTPFLLTQRPTQVKSFDARHLEASYTYTPDSVNYGSVSGDVTYSFSDSGYIGVAYRFIPEGKGDATETGLSFVIPASLTEFRWVGKGPYEAYPGKDRLSEFGIHHLNYNDLYYTGNRQNVACAVFTDAKGAGFALVANDANISVERTAAGIVVSHSSHVAGRFNKYGWPDDLYAFKDGKAISGSFTIVPLTASSPAVLKNLFGDLKTPAKAFQPFYYSYDQ